MRPAVWLCAAAMACQAAQVAGTAARVAPAGTSSRAAGGSPMRIPLTTFAELEKRFDGKFASLGGPNDPLDLLGTTRGFYLDGYGAVFTAEMSLTITPSVNPFRPVISEELKAQTHRKKTERVPLVKQALKEMMKTAAMTLVQVPDNQQFVFAVRLDYLKWEDTMGLPGLIIVKADRKAALAGNFEVEEQ